MNKLAYLQYVLLGIALVVLIYVAIHEASYVEHPTEVEIRVDEGDYMLITPDPPPREAPDPPQDTAGGPRERTARAGAANGEAPAGAAATETNYNANAAMDP